MSNRRGLGSIFRRPGSPYWYIQYSANGRMVRESSGSDKHSDAQRLLKLRHSQITEQRFNPVAEKIRVGELLDDLEAHYNRVGIKSIVSIVQHVAHLRPLLSECFVSRLNTPTINRYVDSRLASGAARGSINLELAYLKRALRLGAKANPPKVYRIPQIELLEVNNVRKGFFEHDQLTKLLPYLPKDVVGPTLFSYYTGMREAEILSLRWNQIEWDANILRLAPGTTKNTLGRVIPINPELKNILDAQKSFSAEWIFPNLKGERKSPNSLSNQFREASEKAGMKGVMFHDLRRTGVRNLVRAGVPEKVAMEISGHKTRSVFERYNIVDERDLHNAMARLSEWHSANSVYKSNQSEVEVVDPRPVN